MLKGQKKLERYTLKFAAQTLFDDDESLRKIDMPYREIFARRDRQMTVEALEKQLQAEDLDAASLLEQLAALQQAQQKSDAEQAKRAGTDTAEAPDPSDNATKATQLDRLRAAFAAAKAKSRAQMGEVAAYCVQDAHLPVRMLDKLQAVTELREKARIFRVPMHVLSFCGMQVIVDGIFDAYFHTHGIIRNTFYSVKYEYPGSFVLKAKHGFFDTPVGTLDFASLYPSIIQAHGLCPTAIPLPEPGAATAETAPLPPGVRAIEVDTTEGIDPADYKKGVEPHVHQVVQNFKGVLPSILETVLGARARIRKVLMAAVYKKVDAAKARLAAAEAANEPTAPFRAEIRSLNGDLATLNGRQLAMKVAANSMYGYFGVRTGSCPCTAIAALTTALGRRALVWTQKAMETAVCMRRTGSTRQEVEDAVAEFRELVSGNRAKRRNPVQPDGASALVRIKCAMRRANTPPALEQAVAAAAERAVRGFRDIWTYDRDRVPAATAAVFQARKILRRLPRRFKQTMLALKHAGLSSRALRAGADALATHAEGKSVHAETAQAAALAVAACAESGLDDRDGAQAAKITAELRRLMADTAPIVIYGDTDSVMVNLGHLRAHAARDEFDWLAEVVSTDVLFKHFPTLVLEAEDQSVMFLLYCDKKKRYIKVIIKWKRVVVSPEDVREDPDHPGSFFTFATAAQDLKLACERVKDKKTGAEVWMAWRIVGFKFTEKGIETKRRDPMPVVKQCAKKAIRLAMPTAPDSEAPVDVSKEATRPQVRAHLAATVAAIVNDELPVHVYAKTQKMRLDYKLGDPAHVVAAKMHNLLVSLGLMDGEMINSGDRTSTVRVFNGDWNAKYVDVAQDPRWVEMHPEKFRVDRVNVLEVLEKVVTRVLPYHFDQRDMKRLFGAARGAVKRQLEGTGDITAALRRKQASSSSGSSGSNSGSSSSGSSNSGSSSGSSSSGSSSSVAATSTAKPRFVPPPFAPGPQFESFESESSGDRFSGEARVQSIAAFLDFGIPAARTPTPTKRRASSGSGGSGGSGGLGGSGGSGGQQKRVRKTATAAAKKKTAKPGGNPFKRKTASTAQAAKKKKRGKAKGKKGPVDAKHSIMRFLKKSK
jgi:DNA polymerase elongation subunit (family B)